MTTLRAEAPITIVNTTIVDNAQLKDSESVLDIHRETAVAWLRGVTFVRNSAARLVVSYLNTQVYSDTVLDYYSRTGGAYATAGAAPGASAGFLSLEDPFIRTATAVRHRALDASPSASHMSSYVSWESPTLTPRCSVSRWPPACMVTTRYVRNARTFCTYMNLLQKQPDARPLTTRMLVVGRHDRPAIRSTVFLQLPAATLAFPRRNRNFPRMTL